MLYASFKDRLCFYGFFVSFKVYANLGSNIAALLYGNLFLLAVKKETRIINDKLLYEMVWQSMRFFRNAKLWPLAVTIYENIPRPFKFSSYESHAIDLTYFSTLVILKKETLASEIADYLGRERESILAEGEKGFSRWRLLLLNIKRLSPLLGADSGELDVYLQLFGNAVADESIRRQQEIVSGDSGKLKNYLKQSLLKLAATRYKMDLVFDNTIAVKIGHRMIADSFAKRDSEAVMLAMIALTDLSMLFDGKIFDEFVPIAFDEPDIGDFYRQYANPMDFLGTAVNQNFQAIVWLSVPEDKLYAMSYQNQVFDFQEINNWNLLQYQAWSREHVPENDFETSIETRYGEVRGLLPEDYEESARKIKASIAFPPLRINKQVTELLLVKDIELSALPFNLLLDTDGQFVGLSAAITDIISIDWLERKLKGNTKTTTYSISAWFPIDAGDGTIQFLYRKCQGFLEDHGAKLYETTQLSQPLSSVINIISSHGGRNISATHVVRPEEKLIVYDINTVVGEGKILVMLVCFSGSAKKDFFRNEIASLVKKYLASGYEAVIAPFWALHIDIPPVWLPEFLKRLEQGALISQAVFQANQAVYDRYPTPAAWAAMHLYGNPYFHIYGTD